MAEQTANSMEKQGDKPRFIHLRVHSAYSLLEGALKTKQIVKQAVLDHEPAIAVTDTNNLFGALEFTQYCMADGVQPIIGCQLAIDFEDEGRDFRIAKPRYASDFTSIVLLAASKAGYDNLVRLVSMAYLESGKRRLANDEAQDGREQAAPTELEAPHILSSWLNGLSDGIIALTGGPRGPINFALADDKTERAAERLRFLSSIFGDRLYVELQRHGDYDRVTESKVIELAYDMQLPLVATNEAFFLSRSGYEAHDALLAIAEQQVVSNPDRRRVTPDHYLKTQDEMVELFKDLPEAIDNTIEIALRCHVVSPTRKPILPHFSSHSDDAAAGVAAEAEEMRRQAQEGLKRRLEAGGPAEGYTVEDYESRLAFEIDVIERMQFPGYFLIVSDFIKWAKAHDIPVGPGRGSGAGSLVAYALTITDIDPLRFSLLFERFLNPDRVSMPDFDIDFCQDRREEVIHYVQEKYGHEQVAQIITFGKLQARAVLRDVGRVLGMSYTQTDRLAKLVPQTPGSNTELAKIVVDEPKFAEERAQDPVVGRLIDISLQLEGLFRHASTHAAGIVIGDRPLWQLVPMYRDPRSDMPVTQFNMKYVEQAGLVKFDFLGLKTLTVLKTAVNFVKRLGVDVDLTNIPLDDKLTYEMLARGETVGVFQVESAGMRKALLGMKPDRIEDVIALVALYRPGPMENIPTYNARKHGEEEIASIHPKIDYLVKETQGVIVYQEQVMQIAQELAGYTLGQADLLRRAMGKKIHAEMEQQRAIFVSGATERGVDRRQANTIFDLLAKFADYGFNKSHAAAYAVVSYQTAYMKAHYPVEFLAATMTYDMLNTEKLNDFRREAQRLGIEVVPPSVQTSYSIFEVGKDRIYYSLAAIKGVGQNVVEHIETVRGDKPFKDIEDFCDRTDPKIINRRTMENLINAGALDCFNIPREMLIIGLDTMNARAQRKKEEKNSGQIDIFGVGGGPTEKLILPPAAPWLASEKLHREFQAIGFYLSAHPLDEYNSLLEKLRVQNWSDFSMAVRHGASAGRLAGTVNAKQIRKTKSGKRMGIVLFSDATGQFEAILFSEGLAQYGDLLEPGQSVVLTVGAENRPEGISLRIQTVQSLENEASRLQKTMRIFLRSSEALSHLSPHLTSGGEGEVSLIMIQHEGQREVEIALSKRYRISPQIAGAIKAISGVVDVELV